MNLPLFLQNFNAASSLGKRQNPNMDVICQEELQKKLKTAFTPMPFQPNLMHFNNNFMQSLEHMQNFQMLLNMNQGFPHLPMMPKAINKPVLTAKDQYVKQEESPIMVKSETNHTVNETASEMSEGRNSPISAPEPVLAEYTKAFPDWDIGTIFSFLQSGQSKESFEKEKEFRAERKKRRAAKKRQIAAKKTSEAAPVKANKINVKLE